jgi:hypothetical protein
MNRHLKSSRHGEFGRPVILRSAHESPYLHSSTLFISGIAEIEGLLTSGSSHFPALAHGYKMGAPHHKMPAK